MCRAYLGPSSGGTTVCIQQLVLIIFLDDVCCPGWGQQGQLTVIIILKIGRFGVWVFFL
jgi:hypothetical protein